MNGSVTKNGRREIPPAGRRFPARSAALWLVVLCWAIPSVALAEGRYLFIADTSLPMARYSKATRQVVEDLIESGFGGRMREGDTLGIWTFNTQVQTGQYPMQRWSRGSSARIAGGAGEFLAQRRYERRANFDILDTYIKAVVSSSESLLIVVLTDGATPFKGTPFDAPINQLYSHYHSELRRSRIPFVTLLEARDGALVGFSVNSAVGPITLPPVPAVAEETPAVAEADDPIEVAAQPPPDVASGNEAADVQPETLPVANPAAESIVEPFILPDPPRLHSEPIQAPGILEGPISLAADSSAHGSMLAVAAEAWQEDEAGAAAGNPIAAAQIQSPVGGDPMIPRGASAERGQSGLSGVAVERALPPGMDRREAVAQTGAIVPRSNRNFLISIGAGAVFVIVILAIALRNSRSRSRSKSSLISRSMDHMR